MSSNSRKTTSVIIACGVVSGIAIPYANPLLFLALLFIWALFALSAVLVLLAGLSNDREAAIFGLAGLAAVVIFIAVGIGLSGFIRHSRHQTAQALVKDLTTYQVKHGTYPSSLSALKQQYDLAELRYYPDSTHRSYTIEYLMDGFNRQYYDSVNQEWGTLGWND